MWTNLVNFANASKVYFQCALEMFEYKWFSLLQFFVIDDGTGNIAKVSRKKCRLYKIGASIFPIELCKAIKKSSKKAAKYFYRNLYEFSTCVKAKKKNCGKCFGVSIEFAMVCKQITSGYRHTTNSVTIDIMHTYKNYPLTRREEKNEWAEKHSKRSNSKKYRKKDPYIIERQWCDTTCITHENVSFGACKNYREKSWNSSWIIYWYENCKCLVKALYNPL